MEIVHVKQVEVVGDHRLHLVFDDGASGVIDVSGWDWSGVFEPLRDPAFFAQVQLDEQLGTSCGRTALMSRPRLSTPG